MEPVYVIKKPLITEKSTFAMNERKQYSFQVDPRANKQDIKRAVESAYGVRVVGVTTQVRKGKSRRMRYGLVQEPSTKKATVRLHPDDTIDLF
jgi:large subunit ribosomal protein L23